jgi:uncharacterized protein YjgD (DUF1641 family)
MAFLEKFSEMPAELDLSVSKDIGPFGLISACHKKEVKQGLGVLMELTKGLGKLKDNSASS